MLQRHHPQHLSTSKVKRAAFVQWQFALQCEYQTTSHILSLCADVSANDTLQLCVCCRVYLLGSRMLKRHHPQHKLPLGTCTSDSQGCASAAAHPPASPAHAMSVFDCVSILFVYHACAHEREHKHGHEHGHEQLLQPVLYFTCSRCSGVISSIG